MSTTEQTQKMTAVEVRAMFEAAIAGVEKTPGEASKDRAANLEIVREWLTNPTFRSRLADYVWQRTKGT